MHLRFLTLAAATSSAAAWNMAPVRSIQARIQGDTPVYDAAHDAFVSSYYKNFEDQYNGVMDTVNLASVEGALKYVQSECIASPTPDCKRKNNVKNVVFYDMTIVQPNASLAQFQQNEAVYPEYGPYLAMDSGACTASGATLPTECLQYNGLNGTANLGPFVGGVTSTADARALYPNTIWFSYPNSCVQTPWSGKTPACRQQFAGGLCPFGVKPDGVKCTFSYTILGWVALDDVVGITSMTNPTTKAPFANYSEFCNAKLTEFSASLLPNNSWGEVTSNLTFWKSPNDPAANQARAQVVVETYSKKLSGNMVAIPTIEALTAANPPCYKNYKACYDAPFGCRRVLYAQVCEVCTSAAPDCVVKDPSYTFPALTLATMPPTMAPTTVPATKAPGAPATSGSSQGGSTPAPKASDASSHVVTGTVAIMALATMW
ncbi:hypothetical protein SPRG_02748 [Saprolegnia parasitica CBS 223.65]|uniref:FZ domain-containing protein n=1 Tax=Saprolegnia parasitica (strain CBS 223.65) TaxID=695850 RepID=A0A067CNL7_SAPPC|nr:hypothetical protein SPRG_02748 [Saprolegnia parasitica CBS 223.65]KDO32269.1 hypothetical protein SPRG_02748 [Saprolegnia parasitica CBS 223.65]|eukprot:XP_012196725.1 hypothetical protein SPRG_02748 [Saprolegnia parasitica CBS 223.65]